MTSPSPWPHEVGIRETQSVPLLALAPEWSRIARKWWDPRPRIMITIRRRVMGGKRTYRFWFRRTAEQRVEAFLAAHRRIYHAHAQPALPAP